MAWPRGSRPAALLTDDDRRHRAIGRRLGNHRSQSSAWAMHSNHAAARRVATSDESTRARAGGKLAARGNNTLGAADNNLAAHSSRPAPRIREWAGMTPGAAPRRPLPRPRRAEALQASPRRRLRANPMPMDRTVKGRPQRLAV